ncbi:MAG: hypothetical protein ACM3UZ_00930 [Acidobacteriota bacterium]
MKVLVTDHGRKRLKNLRQDGILTEDIIDASQKIPGCVPIATRFRGFEAKSGKIFDLVVKDIDDGRLVITIIGKE